ncbi:MAG: RNA ligase family protein [Prosthecobacter sp.]|uniref:RNA ligase family protein n=1 Tax=Prosthecobacter sp. TaxID=1965333 RepID=UPI003BAE98B5
MSNFFRFPHTPHLKWLGQGSPRDDKVLPPQEVTRFLSGDVIVEEKIDGANIGLSIGDDGKVRVQNRGQYLELPFHGQFSRLASWLSQHEIGLEAELDKNMILFGEWCAVRHSVGYSHLPDWFVAFDVYDRKEERFWSTSRRKALATRLGLASVPILFKGKTTLEKLQQLLMQGPSAFSQNSMEGLIIRKEDCDWLQNRAKLVRPDFTQAITEHWSRRQIDLNQIEPASILSHTVN